VNLQLACFTAHYYTKLAVSIIAVVEKYFKSSLWCVFYLGMDRKCAKPELPVTKSKRLEAFLERECAFLLYLV